MVRSLWWVSIIWLVFIIHCVSPSTLTKTNNLYNFFPTSKLKIVLYNIWPAPNGCHWFVFSVILKRWSWSRKRSGLRYSSRPIRPTFFVRALKLSTSSTKETLMGFHLISLRCRVPLIARSWDQRKWRSKGEMAGNGRAREGDREFVEKCCFSLQNDLKDP